LFSQLPFHEILICDNLLYCICLLMELAALVQLRVTHPELPRPFKIPLKIVPLAIMCILPASFCCFVLFTSSVKIILAALLLVGVGVILYGVRTFVLVELSLCRSHASNETVIMALKSQAYYCNVIYY
ncbi:hypothetical protein GUITHDRAFT_146664, partial [Guillardia theta CCMP2712]